MVYLESIYRGLCRGLSRGLRGDYTISIFRLHLSRVKINKQLILHMTLGRDLGKNLGKDLGRDLGRNYTNKNIQPSIVHSFWGCCLGISRVFTKVSAGGYTMIMFSLHIPSIKINKQLILHMTLDSRQRPWKRPCQQLYKQKHTTIDCLFF